MSLWRDLRWRHLQPELMDQPGLDRQQHFLALQGLIRINFLSRSAEILWPRIRSLARQDPRRPVRVLDVASGAGDVTLRLWQLAQREGLLLNIEGCDRSPEAVDFARQKANDGKAPVHFFLADVLTDVLPKNYDIITCSLFLHHLDEEQALRFLRQIAQAAEKLVLINDLVRCEWGYLAAYVGTRLLSRSSIVHVDGPRSVEGAFTLPEALALAERAGLHGAQVAWRWPFRFLLSWRRPCP